MLDEVADDSRPRLVPETEDGETLVDLDALQGQSGVVRLLNSVLMAALQKRASDVHLECFADRVELKTRIDGILAPATRPVDLSHHAGLVARIKVMANLDIAEKRVPQDGRFRLRIGGRDVDFRVSVLPSQHGENVVIRILDKAAATSGRDLSLDRLGFGPDDVAWLRAAIRQPHGLVLMTGPTGSGKTTTLYGALSEITDGREKIITIEDPVEYDLDGITQIAIDERKGLTFASGLRSILRHDPDRIMVGEIRDRETAEIALQAALTGHLVLASVHANDAVHVVSRFTHWGVDLHDFVAALRAVAAQRLLRRLCPHCARPANPGTGLSADNSGERVAGPGCPTCKGAGHSGRVAALERLSVRPVVAEAMIARSGIGGLEAAAREAGMVSLRDSAEALVAAGTVSREEADRVVPKA